MSDTSFSAATTNGRNLTKGAAVARKRAIIGALTITVLLTAGCWIFEQLLREGLR